jgi:hypothetical protein
MTRRTKATESEGCASVRTRETVKHSVLAAILGGALVGVFHSLPSFAQTPARAQTARATSLRCTFALMATGTWVEEQARAEVKAAKVAVEFHAINTDDGTADTKGLFGPPHIVVRLSGGHLHFLQVASEGPVYVTTVFDQPTPSGKLKAVHTRHEYTRVSLPGFTSRPEQYYGDCEVLASK